MSATDAGMEISWKTVQLRSRYFHRSLAVAIISNGDALAQNVFLEFSPLHNHIYAQECFRWLDLHGTHWIRGRER
eukprot:8157778-Lingulodinium_polyedra.AAC.1